MIFLQRSFSRSLGYLSQKYIISMVSKNQIKLLTSLQQKKFRQSNRLFLAEGAKTIGELLNSDFQLEHLYQTEEIFTDLPPNLSSIISENDLNRISALTTSNNCLAVFR